METTEITGATKVLGLIADPIAQARSPAMVNALLRRHECFGDFVLVPMHVAAEGLRDVVTSLRGIQNFCGAIVSMPHKTSIVALLDELTPEARLVGAVNVVRRTGDGRLVGTILDGEGFVAGLRSRGHHVGGRSCLLVGAGGAAAAIAFALARHRCASLAIRNRTSAKAAALATRVREAFPEVWVQAVEGETGGFDIAINATSVGMQPTDELPISPEIVAASTLIADCVVAPETTRLLEVAKGAGRVVHTGAPMLAAQMEMMLRFMGVG